MRSKLLKSNGANDKYDNGNTPKVKSHPHIFPKPLVVDHTITIAINDVGNRIKSDEPVVFLRNSIDRPEDRSEPESKLYEHTDKLTDIPEKYNHRRGDP